MRGYFRSNDWITCLSSCVSTGDEAQWASVMFPDTADCAAGTAAPSDLAPADAVPRTRTPIPAVAATTARRLLRSVTSQPPFVLQQRRRRRRGMYPACEKAGLEVRGDAGRILVGRVRRAVLGVLVPGVGVAAVVEIARERRQLQRVEGVAHDRELVRLGHPERLLGEAGLRAVRQAGGMERDRADLDP